MNLDVAIRADRNALEEFFPESLFTERAGEGIELLGFRFNVVPLDDVGVVVAAADAAVLAEHLPAAFEHPLGCCWCAQ